MKVLIFTEGGSQIGFGHISRCSSLYDELEDKGIDVEFVINGDNQVEEVLSGRKYRIEEWCLAGVVKEAEIKGNISIIDSYKASESLYRLIAEHSVKLLCIDDYNRMPYPRGIVVNPSIYTEELEYPLDRNIKYLLGRDYVILRKTFCCNKLRQVRHEVKEILVTLGGSDIRNLTPQIIETLQNNYPKIKKNVVIGKGYDKIDDIKKISDRNTNILFNLNEDDMKNIMLESDVAITAAGQTVYELLSMGVPFIPIQVIDNQVFTTKGLIKHKLVDKILYWDMVDFQNELLSELGKIISYDKRKEINKKYKDYIDGLGVKRIISELLRDVKV